MNVTRRRIALFLILVCMALIFIGCDRMSTPLSELSPTPGQVASAPELIESPNPAEAFAQATIDYGQSQQLALALQSTKVSLNMSQAANAAAQSTQDYNQRQKMDLDYQATRVSLNITQAAATQKFIAQQTKIARDANAVVESNAAEATRTALLMNVTQTARAQAFLDAQVLKTDQAQVFLNAQVTQTAQAVAVLTAYPLTETPFAVTKAALLMQEYDREQRSFTNKVVAPLIPFLAILLLFLFILTVVMAYRHFMLAPRPRRLLIGGENISPNPMIIIEGETTNHGPRLPGIIPLGPAAANAPRLPDENTVQVEIIRATEPPISFWIAEVEQQLSPQGGLPF